MRTRLMRTGLLMSILLVLIAVAAGSAFGQEINPSIFYRITAKHSDRCLAVAGGVNSLRDGDRVIQWDCIESEDNQKWQLTPTGDGYYKITAKHSEKSLDIDGGPDANRNGAIAQQWGYWGGANQQWKLFPLGDGYYKIISKQSGKSLDVNGGEDATDNGPYVQQWDYWGGANQQWKLIALSTICSRYGDRVTANSGNPTVTNCCTPDPTITSVESRYCEGISPDLPGASTLRRGAETTIAFVPAWTDNGGPHGARLVMGFNGAGPTGFLNWSISTDQGRTWRDRNRCDGGPTGNRVDGCAGVNAVENPTTAFNLYRGDLSVVALPHLPGGVAMVSLGDLVPCPQGCLPNLIVLLVSIDGGETFSKTSIVNDRLGGGITDQPRITVDPEDGTIWVLWRAGRPPLTPLYTYVRGGHIDSNGGVIWDINGDGQLVFSNPVFTTLDYQHPRIKVFTRPGARTHTVAITGPQGAPLTTFYTSGRCAPSGGAIRNSFWQYPLGVFFTVSEDDGRHWTDLHSAVDMGQPFALGCVGGIGGMNATGQLIYSENRIDLARDSRNGNYLVTRAKAVSDQANTFVGQQVEVWRRSITPGARFTRVTLAPWTSANPWQFNPSIAASTDGQIAVSYYQTTGSSQTVELMVIGSRDGGNTWSAPVQLSRNSPWTASDRSLGEYDEIVALPVSVLSPMTPNPSSEFWPGAFYASWSNGVGRVFAAGFTPPPPEP